MYCRINKGGYITIVDPVLNVIQDGDISITEEIKAFILEHSPIKAIDLLPLEIVDLEEFKSLTIVETEKLPSMEFPKSEVLERLEILEQENATLIKGMNKKDLELKLVREELADLMLLTNKSVSPLGE